MATSVYADAMGEAYERLRGLGYERGELDFANHGPMGAEALCTLGFCHEVTSWLERYKHRVAHHDPPSPRFRLDGADETSWRAALGHFTRVGDWEELFARELAEAPWREVLTRWWPRLLPGLLAGLTHGLIRTAHAVRCLSATDQPERLALQELSRGLAYWAGRFRPLPGSVTLSGEHSMAEAVAGISRLAPDRPANPGARVSVLNHHPAYGQALSALGPLAVTRRLSEMTTTFAGVYLAHPEVAPVPLIHGVTAPAAMRLVIGQLPDHLRAASVAAMWQVHVALLLMFTSSSSGERESLHNAAVAAAPSWQELFGQALTHGDEHVIKFAEACYRENALQPDPRFAYAAHAAAQRIGARPDPQRPDRPSIMKAPPPRS
jgi:hypothetical protein